MATINSIDNSSQELIMPATTSSTTGVITIGGNSFLHAYGATADNNTFVGQSAGNFLLTSGTATNNTAVGTVSLPALTIGTGNTALGYFTGHAINSGSNNTLVGLFSGNQMTSGQLNTCLGYATGNAATFNGSYNTILGQSSAGNYTGTESSNILIGNQGTTGESNVMRLGVPGAGSGQISNTFIAGSGGNGYALISRGADSNIWLGGAGNLSYTVGSGNANSAVGQGSQGAITTGIANDSFGINSLAALTSGVHNAAYSDGTLSGITTGSYNTAVGYGSGANYTTSDSSNISIGNVGNAGESNVMRLGTSGSGNLQVNKTFIAGIEGVVISNQNLVTINTSTGQMGSIPAASSGFMSTSTSIGLSTTTGIDYNGVASIGGSATIANAQIVMPYAATLTNLYVRLRLNSSTVNVTITLNVNGSTTTLVATCTALTTGTFSDTTHSVSVNAGDLVCWQASQATTGNITGSISMQAIG